MLVHTSIMFTSNVCLSICIVNLGLGITLRDTYSEDGKFCISYYFSVF